MLTASGPSLLALFLLASAAAQPTSQEQKPFTWTIKPPPTHLVLLSNRETSIVIATGDKAAHNIRIVQSTLQEATTEVLIGTEWLELCNPTRTECKTPINIEPHRTERVILRVDPRFRSHGVFKGNISLAVDEKTDVDSFELTVFSTSWCSRMIGVLLIGIGIGLSWVISVLIRQRSLRAEALLPASELGDAIRRLRTVLERLHKKTNIRLSKTEEHLEDLLQGLSPDRLEDAGYIPRSISNPFKLPRDLSNEYKQFLTDKGIEVTALSVVVRDGMEEAVTFWDEPNATEEVKMALKELDELGKQLNAVEKAKAEVDAVLQRLKSRLGKPKPLQAPAPGGPPAPPSVRELHLQLRWLSIAGWLLWAFLTLIVGIGVLLMKNNGFGVGLDYFKCFLWGLGVQVAGEQLQQLAPTTITSTFSISLPKQ